MKKLTTAQMDRLGIHNAHNFGSPIVLSYSWHRGWTLYAGGLRHRVPGIHGKPQPHRLTPEQMRENLVPRYVSAAQWPDEWARVFGDWVPKDFYDKRMAELVAQYKGRKAREKEQA